jgi:hypothetical protein
MDTFKDRLVDALKRLFASAKFITTIAGLIVYMAARRGIVLSPDDVQAVLLFFGVLVGAQGLTDFGKEKARVEAQYGKLPETAVNQTNISGEK